MSRARTTRLRRAVSPTFGTVRTLDEVRVGHHLDHGRPVVRDGVRERSVERSAIADADAVSAAVAREGREVRVVQRRLPDVPLPRPLLLGDLAELAVVE